MNKKGFTLIELLATLIIIALVMGIVITSATRVSTDNTNKIYEEYEKMIEEYALVSPYRGNAIIKLSKLDNLEKVKHDCQGYAELVGNIPLKYQAHIKCGEWVSPSGYNPTLAN